jgi:hypothetical protein
MFVRATAWQTVMLWQKLILYSIALCDDKWQQLSDATTYSLLLHGGCLL